MQMMSVTSLNTKIKSLLEATFMHVAVEGEVSTLTYHTSGHLYFTIKDEKSSLRCVMWRSSVAKMKFRLEKGMHVVLHGSLSVYTPRGEYQLQVAQAEPYGQGALAIAFEQLKAKLKEKGYFDPAKKKPLVKFPESLALVTAKESAALSDMLRIAQTRWPLIRVVVVDTLVQGEGAANSIAKALKTADRLGVDVVILGRGGGSKEDLWVFNEEIVADAIYQMNTPVVSAVGHEIDTHISDLVADVRAPTPSAAMQIVLPDRYEVLRHLDERVQSFQTAIFVSLQEKRRRLKGVQEQINHLSPLRRLHMFGERFANFKERLNATLLQKISFSQERLTALSDMFHKAISAKISQKQTALDHVKENVQNNDPRRRLRIGWAQVSKGGKAVALKELKEGDRVVLIDAQTYAEAMIRKLKSIESSND